MQSLFDINKVAKEIVEHYRVLSVSTFRQIALLKKRSARGGDPLSIIKLVLRIKSHRSSNGDSHVEYTISHVLCHKVYKIITFRYANYILSEA